MRNSSANQNNTDSGNNASESGTGEFKLVAGVFRDKKNADKRLNILQNLGYDSQILDNGDTHTVIVGTYSSMEAAESAKETLKREHKIRSFIKR